MRALGPFRGPWRAWCVLALGGLLVMGCGQASRARLALVDYSGSEQDAAAREALRVAEPTIPQAWAISALPRLEPPTPAESLAFVERGLEFSPGHPDLLFLRLQLLSQDQPPQLLEQEFQRALADLPSPGLEASLRQRLALVLLAQQRLDEAQAEIIRLGGVLAVPDGTVSELWAQCAVTQAWLGDPDGADASLDRSLARSPAGAQVLGGAVGMALPTQAATRGVLRRARERHPRHADLALAHVQDLLAEDDLDGAEALMASLPEPMPARLGGPRAVLGAELPRLRGQPAEAAAVLMARLDEVLDDRLVLEHLIGLHRETGEPSRDALRNRLIDAAIDGQPAVAYWAREQLRAMVEPTPAAAAEASAAEATDAP